MSQKPREEDFDRFLVVEGYSDLRFYAELLESMGIVDEVYIHMGLSKIEARDFVTLWLTPEKLARATAIAVILDADSSPATTRQSMAGLLSGVSGAVLPPNGGWAKSPSGARVGFFVVPGGDTDEQGELETLAWRAWSSEARNAPKRDCVDTFLRCMRATGSEPGSIDKARIGALLSILNADDPRLGPGAQRRTFDFEDPAYDPLRESLEGFRSVEPRRE